MTLVDKTSKVSGNIDLSSNKELGEEKNPAPEKHQAIEKDHPEVAVAEFVKKDGKLLEQSATQDAQDSGVYEKAAKKAGVKKEELVYTSPTQTAAQAIVSERKHPDIKGENSEDAKGKGSKMLNKSGDWPKSITAMHLDHDLDDPKECARQIKLHMSHAGMADSMESRMWHHKQAGDIYNHMIGKQKYEPVRHNIEKSMKLCKSSWKLNPELTSKEPTHTHNGVKVKVFSHHKGFDSEGKAVRSAEIMEGPDKGKWTTVHEHKLKPLNKAYEGFDKVAANAKASGARDPNAVAAAAGMKKYGKQKMEAAAHSGHKLGKSEPEDTKATAKNMKRAKDEAHEDAKLKAKEDSLKKGTWIGNPTMPPPSLAMSTKESNLKKSLDPKEVWHELSEKLGRDPTEEEHRDEMADRHSHAQDQASDRHELKKSKKDPKFERCVMDVKKKQGTDKVNPWAVCHASLKKSSDYWSKKMEKCGPASMYKSLDLDELRARAKRASKRRRVHLQAARKPEEK